MNDLNMHNVSFLFLYFNYYEFFSILQKEKKGGQMRGCWGGGGSFVPPSFVSAVH